MAHTKAKGTTKLGRDSESKRLGVKIFGGSPIKCGQIILRQRGTKFAQGENVGIGKDHTLYAMIDGFVEFKKIRYSNFNGNKKVKQRVSVVANQNEKKTSKQTPSPKRSKSSVKQTADKDTIKSASTKNVKS